MSLQCEARFLFMKPLHSHIKYSFFLIRPVRGKYCRLKHCKGIPCVLIDFILIGKNFFYICGKTLYLTLQLAVTAIRGSKIATNGNESTHDSDVHLNSGRATEYTGKHGHTLFGEGERSVSQSSLI